MFEWAAGEELWVGQREVLRYQFDGWSEGRKQPCFWVVVGTLAYYLWFKPSQDLKRQQQVIFSLYSIVSPNINLQTTHSL